MKKIHISASPLTHNIYAGYLLKDRTWGKKEEVTDLVLQAVISHLLGIGMSVNYGCYKILIKKYDDKIPF